MHTDITDFWDRYQHFDIEKCCADADLEPNWPERSRGQHCGYQRHGKFTLNRTSSSPYRQAPFHSIQPLTLRGSTPYYGGSCRKYSAYRTATTLRAALISIKGLAAISFSLQTRPFNLPVFVTNFSQQKTN